jgi:ATP-binding cassette subfamily B protein
VPRLRDREAGIRTLARALPWLAPYRRALLLGGVVLLASNALAALGPWILKLAIDSLQGEGSRPVHHWAGALVVLAAVDGVFRYLMRRTIIGVSREVEYDLRRRLYAHLQRLPLSFLEKIEVGDLMARVTNDLNAVRMFLGPGIMYTLNTFLVLAFSIALMMRISPSLTLVALLPLPLVTVIVVLVMSRVHERVMRVQEGFATLTTRVRENLEGIRVVKAFAHEESQNTLFAGACHDYLERNMQLARMQQIFFPAMTLFGGIAGALVLGRGGLLVMRDAITLGDFVAFAGYLALLMWPMAALGWTINLFQRGAASWQRIDALLAEPVEPIERGGAAPPGEGVIRFEGVHLSRGGREILSGIDLTVQPGRITALVGPTGSGKSSLVRLLGRLVEPTEGVVRLDGVPLPEWDLSELRRATSFVPQESFLFSESIADNVQVGRPGTAPEEVRAIAELALLGDEVRAFREGFDSIVGERGVTLSGGQRQRATLARALLRPARVLVLDDAFANMDTRTEEGILAALRARLAGRTVLLVSHRLSTIRRADQVVYLEEGRVVEEGTHEELVRRGGSYARFVRRQRLLEELGQGTGAGEAA